jgi:hypothetical protein
MPYRCCIEIRSRVKPLNDHCAIEFVTLGRAAQNHPRFVGYIRRNDRQVGGALWRVVGVTVERGLTRNKVLFLNIVQRQIVNLTNSGNEGGALVGGRHLQHDRIPGISRARVRQE